MKKLLYFFISTVALSLGIFSISYAAPLQLVATTSTETTAAVTIKGGEDGFILYLQGGGKSYGYIYQFQTPTNATYEKKFTGLAKGTVYSIVVDWYNPDTRDTVLGTVKTKGVEPSNTPAQQTTPPETRHLTIDVKTTATAINVSGTFSGDPTKNYTVSLQLADDTQALNSKTVTAIYNYGAFSYSATFGEGIQRNKTYYLKGGVSLNGVKQFDIPKTEAVTKSANTAQNTPLGVNNAIPFYAKGYTPLAEIPGFTDQLGTNKEGRGTLPSPEQCSSDPTIRFCNIGDLITFIIELAIALAAVILVVKLVIEGYKYMTSDVPFLKSDAKTKITESIIGILLALTSFILLNTINPKLVSNEIVLEKAVLTIVEEELDAPAIDGNGKSINKINIQYNKKYTENDACPGKSDTQSNTCINIPSSLRVDASGRKLERSFAEKLSAFDQKLITNGIQWKVTEAWKPSRAHKAKCHQIGTCIDMNHTPANSMQGLPNPTVSQIQGVISAASSLGMCAKYEVKTREDYNKYINGGVPKSSILLLGNWISANHYSLYNGTCK